MVADQFGPRNTNVTTYAGLGVILKDGPDGWFQYHTNEYEFLRAGRFVSRAGDIFTFDEFVFGFDTATANLPNGDAGYAINLGGTLFNDTDVPQILTGSGNLTVDFLTGQVTASGT